MSMKLATLKLKDIRKSRTPLRDGGSGDIKALADSLKKQGQLVPVMVTQNGTGYRLIYGNRRCAAAKRAGQSTIMGVVADRSMTEVDLLLAAITENMAREDMTSLEKGKALKLLKDKTGWPGSKIGAMVGLAKSYVAELIQLASEPEAVKAFAAGVRAADDGARAIRESRVVEDKQDRIKLLRSAAKKELTGKQVRQRAEALNRATSPVAKKEIIEGEQSEFSERYMRSEARRTKEPPKTAKISPSVRAVLNDLASTIKLIARWAKVLRAEKFSPEAKQFALRKVNVCISALEMFKSQLSRRQ
ncbi:MAG: ParB/RepB/Spo0J family partition protein [Planctomycetes bacterium]|nr:ParB/RepB/Spo0J family partition protein [Planctomycetota bacterium]